MSSPALRVTFSGRPCHPQDTVQVARRDLAQSVGSGGKCRLVEVLGVASEGHGYRIQPLVNIRMTSYGGCPSGQCRGSS